MDRDDLYRATAGGTTNLYYVDVEMFETPQYGPVYLLDAERPAIVDTGTGYRYERVVEALSAVGIEPSALEAICLTHVHLDHAGGAAPLAEACPNADVYVHESGAQFLRDPTRLWEGTKAVLGDRTVYYREPDPVPDARLVELADGDTVDLGDRRLDVHHAPGHDFHQVVYHDRANDGAFTGDAAGIYVPALDTVRQTTPPPGFDLEGCLADIDTLESLSPSALYYGHFGDQPTGDRLAEYREVLADWVARVDRARDELGDDEAVVDSFLEQTETVDAWGREHAHDEERLNLSGVFHYLDQQ